MTTEALVEGDRWLPKGDEPPRRLHAIMAETIWYSTPEFYPEVRPCSWTEWREWTTRHRAKAEKRREES